MSPPEQQLPEIRALAVSEQLPARPKSDGQTPSILKNPSAIAEPSQIRALIPVARRSHYLKLDGRNVGKGLANSRQAPLTASTNRPPPKPRDFDFEVEIVALAEGAQSRTEAFKWKCLQNDAQPTIRYANPFLQWSMHQFCSSVNQSNGRILLLGMLPIFFWTHYVVGEAFDHSLSVSLMEFQDLKGCSCSAVFPSGRSGFALQLLEAIPGLPEPPWGLHLRLCALLNAEELSGPAVVQALKKKITSQSMIRQRISLDLLKACAMNCDKIFSAVASERVLAQMAKMIDNPPTHFSTRERALQLIKAWGDSSDHGYFPVIQQTYLLLTDADDRSLHLEAMRIFDGGELLRKKIMETNFVGLTGLVQFDNDGNLFHPADGIIDVVGTGYRLIGYWSNYSALSVLPPETLYLKPPNHYNATTNLLSVIWPDGSTTVPRGWVFPNNGKQLRIGIPNRVSYKEFVSQIKGTNTVKGFCIDAFTAAINLLPYVVPYKFVPFGDLQNNPSYSKLTYMVASDVTGGAVGDIPNVTNRTRIVDFTQPFIELGLVIVAPVKKMTSNAWAFLRPFTIEMWCVPGVSFLVIGASVWILEHGINHEFRGPPEKQFITIMWFSFSTASLAHREKIGSTLGRLVLAIWLFVVLLIQPSYTANLTSLLTLQQLSSPVKGIDSFKTSEDPIGFQVGSFAENYLVEGVGIARSRLIPLGSPEASVGSLSRGSGNGGVAAVVDELAYIELFLSSHCKFTLVGQEFTKSGWGFAFPLDSPLAVDLLTTILELSENGDLLRIHDKWLKASTYSLQNTEIESHRLHFKSFWGLFVICGIVCCVALLISFVMMLRHFYGHRPDMATSHEAVHKDHEG